MSAGRASSSALLGRSRPLIEPVFATLGAPVMGAAAAMSEAPFGAAGATATGASATEEDDDAAAADAEAVDATDALLIAGGSGRRRNSAMWRKGLGACTPTALLMATLTRCST